MSADTLSSSTGKKYPTSKRGSYLVSAALFALIGLFLAVFTGASLLQGHFRAEDWKNMPRLVGAVVFCFSMASILYGRSRSYIVVSPSGVELHGFGFRIHSSWDNVERIDAIPLSSSLVLPSGWNRKTSLMQDKRPFFMNIINKSRNTSSSVYIEGLVLRQPVSHENDWWAIGMIKQTRFISLEDFEWWRYTGVGYSIKSYAHRLFET